MNCKQVARTGLLAALIVSPTMALLAMQMPFWFPEWKAELTRLISADFDLSRDYQGPAFWPVTVEVDTFGI